LLALLTIIIIAEACGAQEFTNWNGKISRKFGLELDYQASTPFNSNNMHVAALPLHE